MATLTYKLTFMDDGIEVTSEGKITSLPQEKAIAIANEFLEGDFGAEIHDFKIDGIPVECFRKLSKQEAIEEMKKGKKVTHYNFSPDEWMTMSNGNILLEDGCKCTPEEFWRWRIVDSWKDGYNIFNG